MRQRLPDLFGEEGHEGMQHFQDVGQDVAQHLLRLFLGRLILAGQTGLGQLDIPVAIGVPDEVVQLLCSHAQLVVFHVGGHFADDVVELMQNPLVLQLQLFGQLAPVDGQVHEEETGGVPDLVAEVPHGLALFREEPGVVAGAVAGDEVVTEGVAAVLVDHLQGVDAVAQALGHLAALAVAD